MAYTFGDGFDLYGVNSDPSYTGYWEIGGSTSSLRLQSGGSTQFNYGQCIEFGSNQLYLWKISNVNDQLHHFNVRFGQTSTFGSASIMGYISLLDGANAQCTIGFTQGGGIVLTSGGPAGTVIATYATAWQAINIWYSYEIEVFISNTGGYMNVRKNGNYVNDFTSATNLNTRAGSTNNYANRINFGGNTFGTHRFDDFLWRSGASGAVPWIGDVRCYYRVPTGDSGTPQWTRQSTFQNPSFQGAQTSSGFSGGQPRYTLLTSQGGAIGSIVVPITAGFTGNIKCAIFSSSTTAAGSAFTPYALLQAATAPVNNPVAGNITFTFSPPVVIPSGAQFWVGLCTDVGTTTIFTQSNGQPFSYFGYQNVLAYASFPPANVGVLSTSGIGNTLMYAVVTPTANYSATADVFCENIGAITSYNSSGTSGQNDLYTQDATPLVPSKTPPASIVALTTRGLFLRSDAGNRSAAVQLKSGAAAAVESPATVPSTTYCTALWRTDTVDPNTGAAWTVAGMNAATIGPVCKA